MANGFQNGRQRPYPLVEDGKGYQQLLVSRSQAILNALVNLLPSNYESTVVGPNYTVYMKAMATELSRITIILERLGSDVSFDEVRSEFLWETVGYLVFLNQQLPDLEFDDESFREFLKAVIDIYFDGSTPEAIHKGVELFSDDDFILRENFKEARKENSPFDISDQFGFFLDFELEAEFPDDLFKFDKNLRLLIEIIRPAHTLYRLRFVFGDDADLLNKVEDQVRMHLRNYYYDDSRKYCEGMAGFDSTSGYIEVGSLDVLKDDATDKPLASVSEGATLLIETGPNNGRYTVVGHPATNAVRVFPRFQDAANPVTYEVEVDRLGAKQELFVENEDLSSQFYNTARLTVDAGGPYTVEEGETVTLTSSSNGLDVDYVWDLDGDNVYDDASGSSVTFSAPPAGPTEVTVWVLGTDYRGRRAKDSTTITVTDTSMVQMVGTGSLTINDVTLSTSSPTFEMVGTATTDFDADLETLASVSMSSRSLVSIILQRNDPDDCISMYGIAVASIRSSVLINASVDLVGTGTTNINSTVDVSGSVVAAGNASTSISTLTVVSGVVDLDGTASTTVGSTVDALANVVTTGTATLDVTPDASASASVAMTGTASTSMNATVDFDTTITMTGDASTVINSTYTMDPTSITSLVYWIDPSDNTTVYSDSAGTTQASDTDPVELVTDKSGNGYDFINETTVPTYSDPGINGLGVLKFDGTTMYLASQNITELNDGQPITIYAVAEPSNDTVDSYLLNHNYADGSASASENRRLLQFHYDNGDWTLSAYDAAGVLHEAAITSLVNTVRINRAEWSGDNLEVENKDGTVTDTGNADAAPTDINAVELGNVRDAGGVRDRFYQGLSGEILCFESLTSTDKTRLEQYLEDKWLP